MEELEKLEKYIEKEMDSIDPTDINLYNIGKIAAFQKILAQIDILMNSYE